MFHNNLTILVCNYLKQRRRRKKEKRGSRGKIFII